MSYTATVLPVMIASPGDVQEEKEAVRNEVHMWNYIHSARTSLMLNPVSWDTHSSPELGVRPQQLINDRILNECDILIGIFWTRIGSPTGSFPSGTVEEIERHIKDGKPALLYFSSRPVVPDSINSDQFDALHKFKNKCYQSGLIENFDTLEELRQKFARQLQICLDKNNYLQELIKKNIAEHQLSAESLQVHTNLNPEISIEAKELLIAAAQSQGTILLIRYLGGQHISAGDNTYGGSGRREFAKWEHAINELLNYEYIKDRGYKGELFELTHIGWTLADSLITHT